MSVGGRGRGAFGLPGFPQKLISSLIIYVNLQASIIIRKKEAAAEELKEVMDEVNY